jgi:polyisoprenoid-binding protein YceI
MIDPNHSDLSFSIRHFVSRVHGSFDKWNGTITLDTADWTTAVVDIHIDPNTIHTGNTQRDSDLKGADFFDVAKYPEITFKSTSVHRTGDSVVVVGALTMKGVTKPVTLRGAYAFMHAGVRTIVGVEATGTINRTDWGVTWNRALEGGGTLLSDDVTLSLAIEALGPMQTRR